MKNLPPIEKIYEAWSALADGRVRLMQEQEWSVGSSDASKSYMVRYDAATDTYSSTDSATYWRGYPGYPVLAVMMLQGRLPYVPAIAEQWQGVNWTEANARHKRDYAAAVAEVESQRAIDPEPSLQEAQKTMRILEKLDIKTARLRLKTPPTDGGSIF